MRELIEYFTKKIPLDTLTLMNKHRGIVYEKIELYKDFSLSLSHIINDTYLGKDVMNTDENIKSHFDWCWNKNINNFKDENCVFDLDGEHYDYYCSYFTEIFYKDSLEEHNFDSIINFWDGVFSFTQSKSRSEYDVFFEIYLMLDKYLNKNH